VRKGQTDLPTELPADAYELDSNPSIAPSQSASQIAYDDLPSHRGGVPFPKLSSRHGPGSITGSIAEEDEGSSGEDVGPGKLFVHENRAGSRSSPNRAKSPTSTVPAKPSPLGVPSVNARSRPLSTTFGGPANLGGDSDSDAPAYDTGARRAASEVGALGYHPPKGRQPLRRTFSEEQQNNGNPPRRAASDTSSVRRNPKKRGFFASLSKLFKGGKQTRDGRSGRESPPYGSSNKGPWHTRTDTNLSHQSTLTGGRARRGDDSSSEEESGNLVSVANNRNSTFSVENIGRAGHVKRSSSTPLASGLIPAKPTRSDLGANKAGGSQTTLTAKKPGPSRATSPTLGAVRATSPTPSGRKTPTAAASLSRSNTVKSAMSTGTTKSSGTTKKATATRQNGTVSRAAVGSQQAVEGRNIMSLVDMKTPPTMPEVPKAPKSQVNPQMELAKAPGSSLVRPFQGTPTSPGAPRLANGDATPQPARPMSRANSVKQISTDTARSNTPLPPSRSLQPPLKSALRPSSPSPSMSMPALSPPIEPPKTLYTVMAPGPVQLPREVKPAPPPTPMPAPIMPSKRNSYHSTATSDRESVYESAVEDDGEPVREDSSSEEEDEMRYKVVENDKIAQSGVIGGPLAVEKIPVRRDADEASIMSDGTATGQGRPRAPASDAGSRGTRRKSVRMAVPPSPSVETALAPPAPTDGGPSVDREPSPPLEKQQEEWSTRIGRKEDTSDDEDRDPDYASARKGLSRNSGKWEAGKTAGGGEKLKRTKSRGSAKGSVKTSKA